jgi:hypothetical protein
MWRESLPVAGSRSGRVDERGLPAAAVADSMAVAGFAAVAVCEAVVDCAVIMAYLTAIVCGELPFLE